MDGKGNRIQNENKKLSFFCLNRERFFLQKKYCTSKKKSGIKVTQKKTKRNN